MTIRPATQTDIPTIHRLAHEIWWPTYQGFLSHEQITFMLEDMYSEDAIKQQMNVEDVFFLISERESVPVAFAGFSLTEPKRGIFKLHKLYILPSEQGKGTGKTIIERISGLAKARGGQILELNVNRRNPAFNFYKKLGFEIYQTVDIPYYRFKLNDYIMRVNL